MKLETFLYNLHYEIERILPADWRVDWEDAPLPYKLYRGLPEITLNSDIAKTIDEWQPSWDPDLTGIGRLLWYVYGLTHYSQSIGAYDNAEGINQSLRRFVPSGGGLYPNEVYIYLKMNDIPEGVYHYSTAHHRLVLLREGNYDSYLSKSIGNSCDIKDCFGTIFVSTFFWKNFFKYHYFSYRLQGLDAGVVIGQLIETARELGIALKVCYQFLDQPLNHLLGLNESEESVYAVIPLSNHAFMNSTDRCEEIYSVSGLLKEIPVVRHVSYQRSKKINNFPMIKKLNSVSGLESTSDFEKLKKHNCRPEVSSMETVLLPLTKPVSHDFATVCSERYSPEKDFILENVTLKQLAMLCKEVFSFSSDNDIENTSGNASSHLGLYGVFYNVKHVPNGAYFYDNDTHSLRRIASGDFRKPLQSGLTMDNVNLFQVPLCFHIVGEKDHYMKEFGYRGYRIQQMEAGILVQRLLISAGAIGLGGHPLLGFDARICDELYQLKEKTSLIQIPVGPYRQRAWLKGSLIRK